MSGCTQHYLVRVRVAVYGRRLADATADVFSLTGSSCEEEPAVIERKPEQNNDLPPGAAICLVVCVVSLAVVLPMRPPTWLLEALVQALMATTLWISSNR
jgi:hypothetical protein